MFMVKFVRNCQLLLHCVVMFLRACFSVWFYVFPGGNRFQRHKYI